MNVHYYEVGQIVPKFKDYQDGPIFDLADDGAFLIAKFVRPTAKEIREFKIDRRFEIRFTVIQGVILFTMKFGNLSWMDCPYTPHRSKNLTTFQFPDEEGKEGLSLTIFLIDSATGEILNIRMVGLSGEFTRKLFGIVMEQKMEEFNEAEFNMKVRWIYDHYSSDQIAELSEEKCVFEG